MKEIIINCKLETLEDFHIGSGLSDLGMCDEGVVKDEQGRPTIPASTFKGLLRQSSLEFEESMKLFGDTSYDNLKNFIFDFGGKNSIDISCELDRVSLGLTPFLYHTFTEINSNTRKASDKSLRTIEAVSKGTCFLIKISFRITDKEFIDKSDIIVEYLTYGLKNLKWLGSDRRRGLGNIKITDIKSKICDYKREAVKETESESLKLSLELLENTTIGGTAPKGNLTETIDYIPGSMILGALRKVLKDINNEQKDSNNNQDYLDDKNVVVSPFYPTSLEGDDIIVFPTPLSLRRIKSSDIYKGIDKSVPHWVYKKETSDTLSEIVNKCSLIIDNNKNRDDTKDKSFSGGYIVCKTKDFNTTSISQATYYAPRKILSMRNSIDSEKQTTKDNSLFLQEQIVKGTKFVGGITFKDKEMAKEFLADFGMFFSNTDKNLKLHLGTGGKSVKIKKINSTNNSNKSNISNDNDRFKVLKLKDEKGEEYNGFIVTLLSDSILRDDDLRPLKFITDEVLKNYGINDAVIINKIYSNNIIQSYSGTSGLRRFSDIAVTKGSLFLVRYDGREDISSKLKKLETEGIGFRKHEGFGKVIINNPIHLTTFNKEKSTKFSYQRKEGDDIERKKIEKNNSIFKKAELFESSLGKNELSSSFVGKMISLFSSGKSIEDIGKVIEHGLETRSKDKYNCLLNGLKKISVDGIKIENNEMKTQNLLDDDRHLFIQSVVRGLEKYKSEGECEK